MNAETTAALHRGALERQRSTIKATDVQGESLTPDVRYNHDTFFYDLYLDGEVVGYACDPRAARETLEALIAEIRAVGRAA